MGKDTNLKLCSKCDLLLTINSFYLKKGKPISYCKVCHYEDAQERKKRPENQLRYRAARKKENHRIYKSNKETIDKIKAVPCTDCGIKYETYIMEFDHVRGEKLFNISDKLRGFNMEKLLKEINKCDIVCSNCHRRRTYVKNH